MKTYVSAVIPLTTNEPFPEVTARNVPDGEAKVTRTFATPPFVAASTIVPVTFPYCPPAANAGAGGTNAIPAETATTNEMQKATARTVRR